jgi:hypothetical protein
MRKRWKPNPRVIVYLERIAKEKSNERLTKGDRVLTWRNVLREIKRGTRYGIMWHGALLQALRQKS